MSHTSAAFNHSCLKIPLNPSSQLPAPIYEQKYINHVRNQTLKGLEVVDMKRAKAHLNTKYKAFIDFYDSIPDYSDVNHLSNKEFYKKLEALKAKQQSYYEYLDTEFNIENKTEDFADEYKQEANAKKGKNSPKCLKKCATILRRSSPDSEGSLSSVKEIMPPPPSRRSVRIESPKSDSTLTTRNLETPKSSSPCEKPWKRNISSAESKFSESSKFISSLVDSVYEDKDLDDADKDFCDDILKDNQHEDILKEAQTRSLPSSPTKSKGGIVWNDCGITIPKPFKMTVRDEEDKIVEEILARNTKTKKEQPAMFRAHTVPIESKIPLFDKIMEEQELRRQIIKRRSKEALEAKMKPFSFTRREEEERALTRRFSKSSPQLTYDDVPLKVKPFKAKPVPKNLFSNYIYAKMHEDEFYRALKKRIRAEEMLRASALPPAMAAREKTRSARPICPRALREIEKDIDNQIEKLSNRGSDQQSLHQPIGDEENSFITAPRPFHFQTERRSQKRSRSAKKCHRASEYGNTESKRAQSALELQSVNRSNLAAVLRIQSARRRMEREMSRRLQEQKLQEEMRWRERVMRQKPVWQELCYTSEDDIAIRLQARKEEERLRQEEHRHHMELMLGRVQQIPTLFERQSDCSRAQHQHQH